MNSTELTDYIDHVLASLTSDRDTIVAAVDKMVNPELKEKSHVQAAWALASVAFEFNNLRRSLLELQNSVKELNASTTV